MDHTIRTITDRVRSIAQRRPVLGCACALFVTLTATGASFGQDAPTVTPLSVTSISLTSAVFGGIVTDDGGSPITARGICWNTTGQPTVEGFQLQEGSGTGGFATTFHGLSPGTTYYARAYATNAAGTGYSSQVSFVTKGDLKPVFTMKVTPAADPVQLGEPAVFSVELRNIGSGEASNVLVSIPLPEATNFVSADMGPSQPAGSALAQTGQVNNGAVTFNIASLVAGETVTMQLVLDPQSPGAYGVSAFSVSGDQSAQAVGNHGYVVQSGGSALPGVTPVCGAGAAPGLLGLATMLPLVIGARRIRGRR